MTTNSDLSSRKIVKKGRSKDVFKYRAIQNSTILSSAGNDSVIATTLTASTIDLGADNDTITISGATTESLIKLGSGKNKATFGALKNSTIIGGNNVDTIVLNDSTGHETYNNLIQLSGGNDSLTLKNLINNTTIDGGAGIDTLILDAAFDPPQFKIEWDKNRNVYSALVYNAAKLSFLFDIKNFEILQFSKGTNAKLSKDGSITFNGTTSADSLLSTKNSTVNALAGDDTIYVKSTGAATIDGGTGNDTVVVDGSLLFWLDNGQWSISDATLGPKTILKDVENVLSKSPNDPALNYALKTMGALITSQTNTGTIFSSTPGIDTIIGSAGNDSVYHMGNGDILDLSAGGADNVYFDFTTETVSVSVYGAKNTSIFQSVYGGSSISRQETDLRFKDGFITGGQLSLSYARGDAKVDINFLAIPPV